MKTAIKPATAPVISAPATVTSKGAAKPQVIRNVKANIKFRGARAAWYSVLLTYEGKPAADFLAACTAKPPSTPKSGTPEPASGWLRYFTRTKIATLE